MKYLIYFLFLILPNILLANENYSLHALSKFEYRMTEDGIEKYDSPPDSWEFEFKNGKYKLVLTNNKDPLTIIKTDENILVLQQPVLFSGFRIFSFFKKSHKYSMTEVGYVSFPEDAKKMGYISENISVSYGSYVIK